MLYKFIYLLYSLYFVIDSNSNSEDLTTSPVFPSRQLTGQQSAVSAPTTSKLQDAYCSSNSASPWLSKEHGISNGNTSVKAPTQSQYELHLVNFVLIKLP